MIINKMTLEHAINTSRVINAFISNVVVKKYGHISYEQVITASSDKESFNVMIYKNYGEIGTESQGCHYLEEFDFSVEDIKSYMNGEYECT